MGGCAGGALRRLVELRRRSAPREAGPLLGRLVKALTGWAPAIDVAPLARSARQSPVTYASGYFYFPLVFTARFVYPEGQVMETVKGRDHC
ncbi:phage tail terminator protein [Pseudomonas aeruginosa]|uniref:phage tail terminator protein n=1 Tax=Pseudomonas aeruginosa TaxID=287 RepID=UPI003AAAAF64